MNPPGNRSKNFEKTTKKMRQIKFSIFNTSLCYSVLIGRPPINASKIYWFPPSFALPLPLLKISSPLFLNDSPEKTQKKIPLSF